MSANMLRVAPSGECLRGEGLVRLIGAHVRVLQHRWLLPVEVATSEIVKRTVLGLPYK